MKVWQLLAIPVCLGIWLMVAAANIDAMMALAGDGIIFSWQGFSVTARMAYATASVAVDALLAIAAVAVFWQAAQRRWLRATFAVIVWALCAGMSWHSMWLWFGANQGGNVIASSQSQDVYRATKDQLDDAQKHYSWLAQTKTSKMGPNTLMEHRKTVAAAERRLDELRQQLATTRIKTVMAPIEHFDIIGATLFLIVNTLCWPAVFGPRHRQTAVVAPPGGGTFDPVAPPQVAALDPPPPHAATLPPPTPVAGSGGAATETGGGGKKLNDFIAATMVPPAATTAATGPVAPDQVAGQVAPPEPPPPTPPAVPPPPATDPPPPPSKAPPPVAASDKVVILGESHATAVKRWARRRTEGDPKAFSKSSDLWEDYLQHGTLEMRRDEFFKALASEFGGPVKKKAGRGYEGMSIKSKSDRATAT